MSTTCTVNVVNIALMALAAVPAFFLPFETFLFSYAFLGPLHYLTEISWLHDRRYFSSGRIDPWLLGAAAGLLTVWNFRPMTGAFDWTAVMVVVTFAAAAGMAFLKRTPAKLVVGVLALAVAIPLCRNAFRGHLYLLLVPTIVHVFVFTGAFILVGALKQRSRSGLLSLGVFVAIALLFLLTRPSADRYLLEPGTAARAEGFRPMHTILGHLLGFESGWDAAVALMRFIAWAYTYHYLNWFSKTKVIGWHEIPRARAAAIVALWLASIALYLHDWRLGLDLLFFLSLLHVLLEFPLNHQSFVGIGRELRRIVARAPPS